MISNDKDLRNVRRLDAWTVAGKNREWRVLREPGGCWRCIGLQFDQIKWCGTDATPAGARANAVLEIRRGKPQKKMETT